MDRTRPVRVTPTDAWAIQELVKHDMGLKLPKRDEVPAGYQLREKVNDALVRFADEPGLDGFELYLTEEELWLIDQRVPRAGYSGAKDLLLGVFRALRDLGYDLSALAPPTGFAGEAGVP